MLGEFILRERIGDGGMGAVYRCEQPLLGREAVVKVLHHRLRRRGAAHLRFMREAQLASRLDHPYAAHIYAFGVEAEGDEEGLPWIAMELVRGITLGDWLAQRGPMPLDQFVPFFRRVAQVVQAAHACGIVHRDIKPANVMIVELPGELLPKLLDFGVAKLLHGQSLISPPVSPSDLPTAPIRLAIVKARLRTRRPTPVTRTDAAVGTPAYMAPEQWTNPGEVGRAADLYALGIVAYEALTGHLPFHGNSAEQFAEGHCHAAVPPLGAGFSPMLDRVIERALAKRPEDRFANALDLAAALQAEQVAQPSELVRTTAPQWEARGRPRDLLLPGSVLAEIDRALALPTAALVSEPGVSFLAASRQVARRAALNRRLLAVLGVAGALAVIKCQAATQTKMAELQAHDAKLQASAAEQLVTQSEVEQGLAALLHGESSGARQHLGEAWRRGDREPGLTFMFARALQPRLAEQAQFASTKGRMWSAVFSPDSRRIVTTDDTAAQIWDATTYRRLAVLPHGDVVYHAVYSPDGTQIATACGDGAVRIWDAGGALLRELRRGRDAEGKPWRYTVVAWSGRFVAAIDHSGAVAHVWDASTGALLADLPNDATGLASLTFSAHGRWLATSGGDDVRVFDTATWAKALRIEGPRVQCLSFDPHRPRLAVGTEGGDASIWEIPSGSRALHLREVGEPVDRIAFSPSGELAVTASRDGAVQVWGDSGHLQSANNTIHGKIYSTEFSSSGDAVLASGGEGEIVAFDAVTGVADTLLDGPVKLVRSAHFDPSGHRIIGASFDGTVRLWDATSTYRRQSSTSTSGALPAGARTDGPLIHTSPDGRRRVVIPVGDGPVELFDLDRLVARLEGHSGRVWSARFVREGREILTAGADGSSRLWDATTGKLVQLFQSSGSRNLADAALSGDGAVIAAGAGDGTVRFFDTVSGREIWKMQAHATAVIGVDFDGSDVVTRGKAGDLARWELPDPVKVINSCDGQRCGTVVAP